jgi:hypothetical protein
MAKQRMKLATLCHSVFEWFLNRGKTRRCLFFISVPVRMCYHNLVLFFFMFFSLIDNNSREWQTTTTMPTTRRSWPRRWHDGADGRMDGEVGEGDEVANIRKIGMCILCVKLWRRENVGRVEKERKRWM